LVAADAQVFVAAHLEIDPFSAASVQTKIRRGPRAGSVLKPDRKGGRSPGEAALLCPFIEVKAAIAVAVR
jgi:hypothetical protein